jgi:hypothetical protein
MVLWAPVKERDRTGIAIFNYLVSSISFSLCFSRPERNGEIIREEIMQTNLCVRMNHCINVRKDKNLRKIFRINH